MRDTFAKPVRTLISKSTKTLTTDVSTGEILTETELLQEVTKRESAPQLTFTKMFYQDLAKLYGLTRSAMVLFMELAAMIKDDKNHVVITVIERKAITERTGLKPAVIYNATSELVARGLLLRVVNSVYMIDPNLFAVGSDPRVLENRRKFNDLRKISMQIEYTENGRSISVAAE